MTRLFAQQAAACNALVRRRKFEIDFARVLQEIDSMSSGCPSSLPLEIWRTIERVCTEYEAALRAGQTVDLIDLVQQVPAEAQSVLRQELAAISAEYERAGPRAAQISTLTHVKDFAVGIETATGLGPAVVPSPRLTEHPRYRLVRRLGQGSRCVTWQADDRLLRRPVVLRCVHGERVTDTQTAARLLQAVQDLQSWRDPHIATVYEIEVFGQTMIVSSEFVDGSPLTNYLTAERRLTVSEACAAIYAALRGLGLAAEHGLTHGQFTPQSLVRTALGETKIVDYSLCALEATPDALYAAPEKIAGGMIDVRTDVYSLGCILSALLTDGNEVPPKLAQVVAKMTAARPADRYQSAAAAASALRPFLKVTSSKSPKRFWWAAMIFCCLFLFVLWSWNAVESQQIKTISTSDPHVEVAIRDGLVISARDPIEDRDYSVAGGRLILDHAFSDRGLRIPLVDGTSIRLRKDGANWTVIRAEDIQPVAVSPRTASSSDAERGVRETMPFQQKAAPMEPVGEVRRFAGFPEPHWICRCAFTPDGKHVLASSGIIHEWETDSGKAVATYANTAPYGWGLDVSPDGNFVVSAGDDARAYVWLRKARRNLSQWSIDLSGPYGFGSAFSPDGSQLLFWTHYGQGASLWDWKKQKLIRKFTTDEGHWCCRFSSNGRQVLTAGVGNRARVWDVETGEELLSLAEHTGGVCDVVCTSDGRRAVTGSADKTLIVWDLQSGKSLRSLKGHTAGLCKLAIARDDRRVMSCADDRTARVWDLETGQLLAVFEANTNPAANPRVQDVQISPDGKYGLTCAFDGTVRLWRLPDSPASPMDTP